MATVDLSRAAFDPHKRYAGVRMQQGRVNLDDDFNEAARIDDDDDQRTLVHVIGPAGSPDNGFLVSNPHVSGTSLDFDIAAGTMYVGGLRVWNPQTVSFGLQPDWLLQPATARAIPDDGHVDLVYLEVWRQAVSAVEDSELFEAALAGPDTSARVRTMWRVRLASDLAQDDCPTAWSNLTASWTALHLGTIWAETCERVVDAQLKVGLEPGGPVGNLCSPPIAGGYLGAENQAIRVELVSATQFTWGFDNAAPLYRVKVGADLTTIELETEPKDQAHWPISNQIVEILPWSAVLPNNEKLSEASGGHLSRVQASYDPQLRTITLQTPVPAGFGDEWTSRSDAATLAPTTADRHYYMRVWNRGDDLSSPPAISFMPNSSVPLGSTGLNVTFTGSDFVTGDHWIIAARPETPDELVPWSLKAGRPPHGIHRYYTPLALVRWHGGAGGLSWELLHDCRVVFPPLTRIRTCCTYTVGDEKESFGRFTKIQDAVDALPPTGGTVCVLAGEYHEQVTIAGRRNITIEGCGRRSKLFAPPGTDTCAILIVGSQDITVRSLLIDSGERPGIVIWDRQGPTPFGLKSATATPPVFMEAVNLAASVLRTLSTRILLDNLSMAASALPAVAALSGTFITLRNSTIEHGPLLKAIDQNSDAGRWAAVYMLADDVLVENNRIRGIASPKEPTTAAGAPTFRTMGMGGIQIGGGSDRVELRRNTITGGNGDGITLGSWAWVPAPQITLPWEKLIFVWTLTPVGFGVIVNDDGCIEIVWDPPPPKDDAGDPMVPMSMGDVRDIRIVDNTITRMGRAGIGMARWWPLTGRDELIRVERLTIENNRIIECLRLDTPELPDSLREAAATGAIALADGEVVVIRDNLIERNGRSHVDPVCGVFALRAAGIAIERNRILDNAPRTLSQDAPRSGFRGGVFILQALPPGTEVRVGEVTTLRTNGVPAARIHDNVIAVPEGRCIVVMGQGTFAITDNQLTSRGVGTANRGLQGSPNLTTIAGVMDFLGGCTVFGFNLGRSNELGAQIATLQGLKDIEIEPGPGLDPTAPVLAGGDTLFAHNQVSLDLIERGTVSVASSVLLAAVADDVEADGNQMQVEQDRDVVAVNALVAAWSARFNGNRCEETLIVDNEVTNALSAYVLAPLAAAGSNITTHCMLIVATLRAVANNIALIRAFNRDACGGTLDATRALISRYMKG
jgi:uncharacterized protein DUF6519